MAKRIAALVVLLACCVPRPAHAYLDPASGSLLLQLLVGGIAGLSVLARLFWRRITVFFKRGKRPTDEEANADHQ